MMYRQGDVLIKPIDNFPPNLKPVERDKGRVVLAYGEATGHAHAIHEKEAVLSEADNCRYLEVLKAEGVELVHEEHAAVTLLPGKYEVIRQREFDDWDGVRNVVD